MPKPDDELSEPINAGSSAADADDEGAGSGGKKKCRLVAAGGVAAAALVAVGVFLAVDLSGSSGKEKPPELYELDFPAGFFMDPEHAAAGLLNGTRIVAIEKVYGPPTGHPFTPDRPGRCSCAPVREARAAYQSARAALVASEAALEPLEYEDYVAINATKDRIEEADAINEKAKEEFALADDIWSADEDALEAATAEVDRISQLCGTPVPPPNCEQQLAAANHTRQQKEVKADLSEETRNRAMQTQTAAQEQLDAEETLLQETEDKRCANAPGPPWADSLRQKVTRACALAGTRTWRTAERISRR